MKKISAIKQNDFKDCGVCCMQWIIIYYDGYISLEKLREDTYTTSLGTNAYHIVNAFKKWGFDAIGIKEDDISADSITFPLIAHLQLKNGLEHFVVVKMVDKDTVYLMDPGVGDRKIKIEEFKELYTGHLIIARPRSKIIKMTKGLTINNLFLNILYEERFLFIKIIFISIILTIVSLLVSYYLKIGTNLLSTNHNYLNYLIIIFIFVIIFKVIFTYIREYYLNHLNNLVDSIVYPEFLEHIFYLPFRSIKSRTTGEVITRINDLSNIKSLFSEIFITTFLDTLMMLASTFVLYIINSKLLMILLIFIIIYFVFGLSISKIIYKKISENINYQTEFNGVVTEGINGLESLKNLNVTKEYLFKIEKVLAKYLYHNYKFNSLFNRCNFIKNLILEVMFFIINSYGLWCISKGSLEIVNLFTFNLILNYFTSPIINVVELMPKYNFIKSSFNKLTEFINIKEEKISPSIVNLNGNITFLNVSYSYNNYDYILKNVSFSITKGMHVLLNGPSGCGKSTICKLIFKEIIPSDGEVLIDGINIKDIDLSIIRNSVIYVSQKEELFTSSIKDNILMSRKVDDKKFRSICHICEIEDIVKKKSLRYDALIENSSINLSGGERQRIILARGLLKDANIIILDEALSEVDKQREIRIIKKIRNYFQDKTIIYISHKNQKRNFENIIEVANGLF